MDGERGCISRNHFGSFCRGRTDGARTHPPFRRVSIHCAALIMTASVVILLLQGVCGLVPASRLVVENTVAATTGRCHSSVGAIGPERSLASFMKQDPKDLAIGLKVSANRCIRTPCPHLCHHILNSVARDLQHHLNGVLDVHVTGEENIESGLVLSSKQRVYIGPKALGLWVQPNLLLWVRSRRQQRLLCEASYIAGDAAQGLQLKHLSVHTRLTWIESAIDHLKGATVPCLLMSSKLEFECDMSTPASRPLLSRFVPSSLLNFACRRAINTALADMQGAVGAALVESYEEWFDWQSMAVPPAMEPAAPVARCL